MGQLAFDALDRDGDGKVTGKDFGAASGVAGTVISAMDRVSLLPSCVGACHVRRAANGWVRGGSQDGDGELSRAEVAAITGAAASMLLLYASKRAGGPGGDSSA